jgi:hypothetical protein
VKSTPHSRKLAKTMSAATAMTGVTATAITGLSGAPAHATARPAGTGGHHVDVLFNRDTYLVQVCGSTRNSTWTCTPKYSTFASFGHSQYQIGSFLFKGVVNIWSWTFGGAEPRMGHGIPCFLSANNSTSGWASCDTFLRHYNGF